MRREHRASHPTWWDEGCPVVAHVPLEVQALCRIQAMPPIDTGDGVGGVLLDRGARWDGDRQLWVCPTATAAGALHWRPRASSRAGRSQRPAKMPDERAMTRAHLAAKRPPTFRQFFRDWTDWAGTADVEYRALPRWQRRAIRRHAFREWVLLVARDFAPEHWPAPVQVAAAAAQMVPQPSKPAAVIRRRRTCLDPGGFPDGVTETRTDYRWTRQTRHCDVPRARPEVRTRRRVTGAPRVHPPERMGGLNGGPPVRRPVPWASFDEPLTPAERERGLGLI